MTTGSVSHNKRTVLLNAAWNWLSFATGVAVTFIVCPIYLQTLGDERYGIWSLVESVVAYFALLDMGIGASVVRYVAKFEAVRDHDELNRVFSTTCVLFAGAAFIAFIGSAVSALSWQRPLGVPTELTADTRWLVLLLGCNVAVELVAGVFAAVLYGLGRFPARVSTEIGIKIGGAAAMVTVLTTGGGLLGIGIVCLTATVIKGCIWAALVWRYLPALRFSRSFVNSNTFRTIRAYSALAFVAMIAGRISFSTDSVVIGAFMAPEFITYFVLSARLTEHLKGASRSLTNVLTPAISSLEAIGRHGAIRRAFTDATRYVSLLVFPSVMGLIVLGKPFLTLWLGERLGSLSYPTLVILSVPLFLLVSQSTSARVLYGIGQLKWFTTIVLAEALINLLLTIGLVGSMGIEGVALGTAVPDVCAVVVLVIYTSRVLGVPLLDYAMRSFVRPFLLALVAPAVWLPAMYWMPIANWPTFVLVGALGTLAYACVAALVELGPGAIVDLSQLSWRRLRRRLATPTKESDVPRINPAE